MTDILRRADYVLSETDPLKLKPSHGEVAFVGRSNVGKSSFINALCQRKGLAVVSQEPGRTRAINVFNVGHFRWLVDLPGYGFAKGTDESREKWASMIEGYLKSRPNLRTVFLLIDSKVGPTPLDFQMQEWLVTYNLPYDLVANKIDQVKPSQRFSQQKKIGEAFGMRPDELAWVSAKDGTGMDALRKRVITLLELN